MEKLKTPGDRLNYYIKVAAETNINNFCTIAEINGVVTIRKYCKNQSPVKLDTIKPITKVISDFPTGWIMEGIGEKPPKGSVDLSKYDNKNTCELCKEKDKWIAFLEARNKELTDDLISLNQKNDQLLKKRDKED